MQELNKIIKEEYNSRLRYQITLLIIMNFIFILSSIFMKQSPDASYVGLVLIGMFNVWYIRNIE